MRDRDALLRAIAANHRSWFRRRGGALQECGGIDLIVEGSDGTIAFPAKRTRAAVAAALDRARELKLRTVSCWSLTDDKALGTLLIARGFEWGWQPWWMALDLARLPTDEPRHRLIHDRWREGFHVFTVRDEDRVIGGVSVNPWRGIAGIYDMGVRPEHRRRGIGRALTLAACRIARDAGCTHAVLNATSEGEMLYSTVGFERLGEGRTWWRHPGERTTPRQQELVEAIGFGEIERLEALKPTRAELERPIGRAGAPLEIAALTGQPRATEWILARRPELASGLGDELWRSG